MARPKKQQILNTCKNCNNDFYTIPSKIREFCSKPCAQQFKGKDKSWLEKRKSTCLEKYGNEIAFKSKQVQDKYKQNLIDKYGVNNPFLIKEVQDKTKDTNLKRYGFEIASKNESIKEKMSVSLKGIIKDRKNYSEIKWEKIINYCKETDLIPLFDQQYLEENKLNHKFQNKFKFQCSKCQEITEVFLSNGYLPTCKCSNYKGYSLIEDEIYVFLLSYFDKEDIHLNRRDIIKNRQEIDIFIPKHNIAIEINGIYWHSESMGKYKDYHLHKTKECNVKNIHLIHILDYEWLFKKEIVKSIILSQLGLMTNKIYARKCVIKKIVDTKIIRSFLDNNHIQGYTHASTSLGLYYDEELVSIMTFGKNRFNHNNNEYELVRFANKLNTNVVGGASKLFKEFINNNQYSIIYSFADNRWSSHNTIYSKLGFIEKVKSSPGYWYTKNFTERFHRFNFNKNRLKTLGLDINNKTEFELMKEIGYTKVWDCGVTRYEYPFIFP